MSSERGGTRRDARRTLCWLAIVAVGLIFSCDDGLSFSSEGPSGFVGTAGGFPIPAGSPPPIGGTGGQPTPPDDPSMDAGVVRPRCPSQPADCEVRVVRLEQATTPCLLELVGFDVVDPARACRGELRLDQQRVPCGGADGWQVTADGRYVLLLGGACAAFRGGAGVTAAFPCDLACPVPVTSSGDDDAGVEPPGPGEDAGAD